MKSIWARVALQALAWMAVINTVIGLLYWRNGGWQGHPFGDVLFGVAAVEIFAAAITLMRTPQEQEGPPGIYGTAAQATRSTAAEERIQQVESFVFQQMFGVRLLLAGLMTVLLSVVFSYWIRF